MTTALMSVALVLTSAFALRLYRRTEMRSSPARPKVAWRAMKK